MGIEGKVAKVLNRKELVINKGLDDGVEAGMKFDVQGEEAVVDPDSGAVLGHLTRPKISVEVVETESRFSIARTFETYRILDLSQRTSMVLGGPQYVTRAKSFHTGSQPEFTEGSVNVSVGDLVTESQQIKA